MAERIDLENQILEIERALKLYPKVKSGDPLQAIKWGLYVKKRRLRLLIAKMSGSHTFAQAVQLINSVNGACAICGRTDSPSIDHVVPISKGGSDGVDNLRVLCTSCNSRKGGKYAQ